MLGWSGDHRCLVGKPSYCPACMQDGLRLRHFPDPTIGEKHWHCTCCGAEWDVTSLIEALEVNELADTNNAVEEENIGASAGNGEDRQDALG